MQFSKRITKHSPPAIAAGRVGESQQDAGRDRVAGARMMLTPQAAISEVNEAHTPQKNGSCIKPAMEASSFRAKESRQRSGRIARSPCDAARKVSLIWPKGMHFVVTVC